MTLQPLKRSNTLGWQREAMRYVTSGCGMANCSQISAQSQIIAHFGTMPAFIRTPMAEFTANTSPFNLSRFERSDGPAPQSDTVPSFVSSNLANGAWPRSNVAATLPFISPCVAVHSMFSTSGMITASFPSPFLKPRNGYSGEAVTSPESVFLLTASLTLLPERPAARPRQDRARQRGRCRLRHAGERKPGERAACRVVDADDAGSSRCTRQEDAIRGNR